MRTLLHIDDPSPVPRPSDIDGWRPRAPDQHPEDWLTVAEAVVFALRGSTPRAVAAGFAGIHPSTLSVWIRRGTDALNQMTIDGRDEPEPTEEPYVRLALDVMRTEAAGQVGVVADVRSKAKKDWRAGAWILQHHPNYREHWQPSPTRVGVTMSGDTSGIIGSVPSHEDIDELASAAEMRALEAGEVLDVEEAG